MVLTLLGVPSSSLRSLLHVIFVDDSALIEIERFEHLSVNVITWELLNGFSAGWALPFIVIYRAQLHVGLSLIGAIFEHSGGVAILVIAAKRSCTTIVHGMFFANDSCLFWVRWLVRGIHVLRSCTRVLLLNVGLPD